MDYFFPTFLIKIDMSRTREHSTQTAQSSPVGCSRRVHKIVYLAVKRVIFVHYLVSYWTSIVMWWLRCSSTVTNYRGTLTDWRHRTLDGIRVTTRDFQQCGILTSVDSDEPVQPPVKQRNSKWCSVSSLTVIEYSSDKQMLWSVCTYAQGRSEPLLVINTTFFGNLI